MRVWEWHEIDTDCPEFAYSFVSENPINSFSNWKRVQFTPFPNPKMDITSKKLCSSLSSNFSLENLRHAYILVREAAKKSSSTSGQSTKAIKSGLLIPGLEPLHSVKYNRFTYFTIITIRSKREAASALLTRLQIFYFHICWIVHWQSMFSLW